MKNDNLLRHMVAVRDGTPSQFTGNAAKIANAVACEHGFMQDDIITVKGHEWLKSHLTLNSGGPSMDAFAILKGVMPPVVFAAMKEIVQGGMGLEEFERRHCIPSRSAKVIVMIGRQMTERTKEFCK